MGAYYSATRFAAGGLFGLLTRWEIRGRERVPRSGGLIVASNHISFWDPPIIGAAFPRETHFLAKEELFRAPGLGLAIRLLNAIPIRRGVADLSGLSRALEVLKLPETEIEPAPGVFQEGERSYVTGVGKLDSRLVILVDLARVLERGELRHLAEAAETAAAPVASR